jgi:hypothetical protein
MKRITFTFFLFSLTLSLSWAQTQVIKGTIYDQQSEMPLIGVTVELLDSDQQTVSGTVTDFDGYYRLEKVPLGRQTLRFSYLGYEALTVPNVVVTAGKEVIMDLQMEESVTELEAVVVTGTVDKDRTQKRTGDDLGTYFQRRGGQPLFRWQRRRSPPGQQLRRGFDGR